MELTRGGNKNGPPYQMMVDWSALKSFRRRLIRKKENARTDLTENEESDSEEDEDNYENLLDI